MSKILIVEDEESIAELEKDYLELSGFEVEIENRGDTGLERALKEEFDLFILDLMLPGTDGFEICQPNPPGEEHADPDGIRQEGRYRQDPRSGSGCRRLYHKALQPQ